MSRLGLLFAKLLRPVFCSSLFVAGLWWTGAPVSQATASEVGASDIKPIPPLVAQASQVREGNQISLNGRTWPIAWSQWQSSGRTRIGISDVGLMRLAGVDLLNTENPLQQPIQWFSQTTGAASALPTRLSSQYRYLDLTDFAQQAGWRLQASGTTLQIVSPAATVTGVRQGRQPWGDRIVIDLDRSTPWQLDQQGSEITVTLDAAATPALIERFRPPATSSNTSNRLPSPPAQSTPPTTPPQRLPLKLESTQNQTRIQFTLPTGLQAQALTLANPNRLVIDVRSDAAVAREIVWAPGIRWRQQVVTAGSAQFPVVLLSLDPRQPGLKLRPIWTNPQTLVGIAPLIQTAQRWQATAAINAGFFNRNNQMPLGAIRQDGRWLSGPILNRGAIAWNELGDVKMARLSLQETLATTTGQRLPILQLNSGYVQAGIARYTPDWGPTYSPLTDNEILITVQNNQVITQQPGGPTGKTSFPLLPNTYLLVLRSNQAAATALPIGMMVRLETATLPADFSRYSQVIGAGPLLLQNRQIVLDAKMERFSDAFIREKAVRSAIGRTSEGNLLIVAVQNRLGGAGPTLAETAQIMQQLGAVDALNLDGGSSTTLYLGGQLLNRSPRTAARVHNGIGVFVDSVP